MPNIKRRLYRQIRNLKLRTKLLLGYVLIAAVTTGALGVVLYNYSMEVFTKEAENRSSEIMKQINSNFETGINEMDLLVNYIYLRKIGNYAPFVDVFLEHKADVPASLLHADWEFDKLFEDIVYFRHDCNGMFIYGDNGIRFSKFLYITTGSYEIDSEWYIRTLENKGKTTIFGTHRQCDSDDGMLVFSIAKQIVHPVSNRGIAVILLDFDLSMLKRICKGIDLGDGSSIIICDNRNNIVYHTDESRIMDRVDDGIASQTDGNVSGATNVELNGRQYLLIYDTLPLPDWKIVTLIPMSTLMRPWKVMESIVLIAGITLIVMISAVSYFLSSLITRPVLNLTGQVRAVEAGDYSTAWTYESKDEVGQLSKGLNSMVSRIKELIQNEYKAKLAENESELKALQAQINPHFIYNTLEVISAMATVRDAPEIDEVAIALAGMMRYSIKTKGNIVPLRAELQHIDDYLVVYNARFNNGIRVNKQIDGRFLDYGILKLTLQPLIENAIAHGIENSARDGVITISAEEEGGVLYLRVADNGAGIPERKLDEIRAVFRKDMESMAWDMDKSESIGLRNVNARLFLYYGGNYGIAIDSTENEGTVVTVKIPARPAGG